MKTIVSVCCKDDYDWQSAIDYKFEETDEAIKFLKLSLSHGFKCLVFDEEE